MSDYVVPDDQQQQPTTRAVPNAADLFRKMAEAIDRNKGADFGGAVVIVPPAGDNPVEILMLNSQKDPAQFWGALDATVRMALAQLDDQARTSQAFKRR